MKALVGAFNQEKALVGAFSVIVQPVVEPVDRFTVLYLILVARVSTLVPLSTRLLKMWQIPNRATHVILFMVTVSSVLINTPSMFACRIM